MAVEALDPGDPTQVGGHRVSGSTDPARDSSLEIDKRPGDIWLLTPTQPRPPNVATTSRRRHASARKVNPTAMRVARRPVSGSAHLLDALGRGVERVGDRGPASARARSAATTRTLRTRRDLLLEAAECAVVAVHQFRRRPSAAITVRALVADLAELATQGPRDARLELSGQAQQALSCPSSQACGIAGR